MCAAGKSKRIAEASIFEVVHLAVPTVVRPWIRARTGIQRNYFQPSFAEKFERHASAGACADYGYVIDFCRHKGFSSSYEY